MEHNNWEDGNGCIFCMSAIQFVSNISQQHTVAHLCQPSSANKAKKQAALCNKPAQPNSRLSTSVQCLRQSPIYVQDHRKKCEVMYL